MRTGDKTLRLYVGELLEMVRPKPERKTKAAPAKTSTPMVMAGKNYRIGCAWPGRPTSICSNWWIGCGPD